MPHQSRDARFLYAANRARGALSVIRFRSHRVVRTGHNPHASPDLGSVSAIGRARWPSGLYSGAVHAIGPRNGRLLARSPLGGGSHGLSAWPQPGRYSLGHAGILR